MAYTPTAWKNGEFPPIDAEHLNKIEQGIANSAPGGFGLGNSEPRYATTDTAGPYSADTIAETCFFVAKTNTPTGDWCYGICISRSTNQKIQIMWSEQGSGSWYYDGCYAERIMKAGTWGPWEWINPPMVTDDQYSSYRTTERYKGEPVFKGRLGDFEVWHRGPVENTTTWASTGKSVTYDITAGATKNIALQSNHTFIVSCSDNVRAGVAIVQSAGSSIIAITPIVPLLNWGIETGSGTTVNIIEKNTLYNMTISIMML